MSEANIGSVGEGCAKAACILPCLAIWHNSRSHSEHRHETAEPMAWCLGWLAEPLLLNKICIPGIALHRLCSQESRTCLPCPGCCCLAHQETDLVRAMVGWERLQTSKESREQQGMPAAWSTHSGPKGMRKKGPVRCQILLKVAALEQCRLSQLKFMSPKTSFQIDMFNFSLSTNVLCFCRRYQ